MTTSKITTSEFIKIARIIAYDLIKIIEESKEAKEIVDKAISIIENYIKTSKNNIDNFILLPFCTLIRTFLKIPRK